MGNYGKQKRPKTRLEMQRGKHPFWGYARTRLWESSQSHSCSSCIYLELNLPEVQFQLGPTPTPALKPLMAPSYPLNSPNLFLWHESPFVISLHLPSRPRILWMYIFWSLFILEYMQFQQMAEIFSLLPRQFSLHSTISPTWSIYFLRAFDNFILQSFYWNFHF